MKKLLPLLLILMFGCGSDKSKNSVNSSDRPDTVGQQVMPQPPVSADSAGARKNQERSSMDTIKRP